MLGNVPIRSKLVVTLIGPLLVLGVLALVGIRSNQAESARAGRSNAFARLAAGLAPLVHELQGERSLSLAYIDSRRQRWRPQLAEQIQYGLSELGRLREQRQAIDSEKIARGELAVEPRIEQQEEEGEENVGAATAQGHGPLDSPRKALDQYTDTINDLLDINTEIAPGSDDERLLKAVAASVALARAKDFADLQRGLLQNVFAADRFGTNEYGKLTSLVAAEAIYDAQFDNAATPEQHELLERTVTGVELAKGMVQTALEGEDERKLNVDAPDWFAATTVKQDRLRAVEQRLSADVIGISAAVRQAADRRALLSSLLLAGTLVLALALALIAARSLIRPLGRLEAAAVGTAGRLPGVVQRLEDGEQVDLAAESAALIENAVTFSAPGTQALVAGQPLPAGYLIEIEDQGLGMSDEQLVRVNERLASPPDADFALAKMLGFFVVTQLAAKHGIRVQLRHSWYGGITALVLLPAAVLLRPSPEMATRPGEPQRAGRRPPVPALDDPGLAWVDSRVPMVHVPLRRPPDHPSGGDPGQPS